MIESRSTSNGVLALPTAACKMEADAETDLEVLSIFSVLETSFLAVALTSGFGQGSASAASASDGEWWGPYCLFGVGYRSDDVTEGIDK